MRNLAPPPPADGRSERRMAGAAGLEPVTSAVTGQRSNQLSYAPARECERRKSLRARQAEVRKYSGSRRQGGGGGEPR